MGEEDKQKRGLVDKAIDFIFSDDSRKYLLVILLIGIVLRFFVARNMPPVADEMVHGTHAIGFINLNALSSMTQCPIWFFLTDLSYKIFNVTLFSARFLSFFYGGLTIILVFLISSLLFNKKIALISSFLLAVSAFQISWVAVYMDQAMMFFILFAAYFFIKEYQTKKQISILASLFLGIALLIKIIAGVFSIIFAFFMTLILYKNYKTDKVAFKKNLARVIISAVIIILLFLPVLSYNYFLYKEKGIVDLPFSMYFNINQTFYQGAGLAHETGFNLGSAPNSIKAVIIDYLLKNDPLILLLGICGIFLAFRLFKEKRFFLWFLISLIILPLVIIAVSILLPTHYTSFMPLFSIFGGISLARLSEFLGKGFRHKSILLILMLIILIFTFSVIWENLSSRSAVGKMREFTISSVDSNTLIVVDSRIYRGTIAWMFNDKHYVESSLLPAVIQASQDLPGNPSNIHTLFIECVPDDCGWGSIKDQPDFNKSTEDIISFFENISTKQDITGGGGRGYEIKNAPYFTVYDTHLALNPAVLSQVDQTHEFFFYPVRRYLSPARAFDYYEVNSGFDSLLNLTAHASLYFSILFAIASVPLLFYKLLKDK
ncbi:MAG: glycosyltransferase family 39 protein [Nanoarchaeota archaeon]|nr:glycosyltransferase family 39 protein [Nanoarchaeota archaeon]MBU4086493.1 glycosyltransferase family 39 protein [Nanoarchaeota archaeon]